MSNFPDILHLAEKNASCARAVGWDLGDFTCS